MNFVLSENEIDILTKQQTALLTDRLDNEARVRGILLALEDIIGAKRSFASYLLGRDLRYIKNGVGTQIEQYLQQVIQGFDRDGNALMSDPELAEINRRRRQMGAGVHHERRLQNREIIENTTYFRDAFEPAGMHHVIGLTAPLPVGEAVFAFGFDGPEDPGFSGSRAENLLRLVLPAFDAGFRRAFALSEAQDTLAQTLASVPGSRLLQKRSGARDGRGLVLPGPAIPGAERSWIIIDSSSGVDPEMLKQTAASRGLTPRQTEVMSLMLEGLSSTAISERLGISPHTARRHCEAVLKRLNVKSRAAIWSALEKTNSS